ncbi:MAG: SDR family oxidoreductase [Spirochaetes bacterium]|nr:SDR family oxidoreductase [Spirochaetota bacterium]
MKNLDGKVTLITGGASGIGAAIAHEFGFHGASIAIVDIDKKALQKQVALLQSKNIPVIGIQCDIASEKQCSVAIAKIIKKCGGIDILVNNAGITQRSLFVDTHTKVFRKVMDVNFFGALYCTKAAVHSIIERKGVIVVITSIAGIAPLYGRTGYSASKHALHGLFESLRSELTHYGVHVMMVCPSFTQTNLQLRALSGNGSVNISKRAVVGKEATPDTVAKAVYKGIIKRKRTLVLTPVGKLSYIVARVFPCLYEKLMIDSVKKEFQ